MRSIPRVALLSLLASCTVSRDPDAGLDAPSSLPDVPSLLDVPFDSGGMVCGCRPGPHDSHVYVLGDEGELYAFDPVEETFTYVIAPVCAPLGRPFSMAVDPGGLAWILDAETRRIARFDLVTPGACTDAGFLPTNPDFPLFGMGFSTPDVDAVCASLYVSSYSGEGPFSEGPDLGAVGVVETSAGGGLAVRELASSDYDGAEMTGTGDGRLFAFGGVTPAKLIELDRTSGEVIEVLPLEGMPRTNASAFAFFAGDFYFFTEALPEDCDACMAEHCSEARAACDADVTCAEQLACAIERGRVSDECGGGAGAEILSCLETCVDSCLSSARARVSQVTRLDWDRSDGPDRTLTVLPTRAPIRIVGAGTSPCVPTVPF